MGSVRIDLSDRIKALNQRASPIPPEDTRPFFERYNPLATSTLLKVGEAVSKDPRDYSWAATPTRIASGIAGGAAFPIMGPAAALIPAAGNIAAQGMERRPDINLVAPALAGLTAPMGASGFAQSARLGGSLSGLDTLAEQQFGSNQPHIPTQEEIWQGAESTAIGAGAGAGLYGAAKGIGAALRPRTESLPPPNIPPPPSGPTTPPLFNRGQVTTSTGQFPGGPPPGGPTPTVAIPSGPTTTGSWPVNVSKEGTPSTFFSGLPKPFKTLGELIDVIPKTEDAKFNNLVERLRSLNKKETLSDSELYGYDNLLKSIRNHPSLPEGFGDEWDILDAKFTRGKKPPDDGEGGGGAPVVKSPDIPPKTPTGKVKRHPVTGRIIEPPKTTDTGSELPPPVTGDPEADFGLDKANRLMDEVNRLKAEGQKPIAPDDPIRDLSPEERQRIKDEIAQKQRDSLATPFDYYFLERIKLLENELLRKSQMESLTGGEPIDETLDVARRMNQGPPKFPFERLDETDIRILNNRTPEELARRLKDLYDIDTADLTGTELREAQAITRYFDENPQHDWPSLAGGTKSPKPEFPKDQDYDYGDSPTYKKLGQAYDDIEAGFADEDFEITQRGLNVLRDFKDGKFEGFTQEDLEYYDDIIDRIANLDERFVDNGIVDRLHRQTRPGGGTGEPIPITPEPEKWTQTIDRYNDLRETIRNDEATLEDLQDFLRINQQMRDNIGDVVQAYGFDRESIEAMLADEGQIVGRLLDEGAFKEPRVDIDEQMPAVRIPGENDPTLFDIPITPDTVRTQLPQTMQDIIDAYKILNEGLNTRNPDRINEATRMLRSIDKDRLRGMPPEYIDRAREIMKNVSDRAKRMHEEGKPGQVMDWLKPFIDDESGEFDPGGMWKYIKELGKRFFKEEKGTFDPFDRFKKVRRPDWSDRPPRVSLHGDEVIPEVAFQPDEGTVTQGQMKEQWGEPKDRIDKDTRTMPESWMNTIAFEDPNDWVTAERIYQETNPERIVKNFAEYTRKFADAAEKFGDAQHIPISERGSEYGGIVANYRRMQNLKDLAQSKYERATFRQLEGGIEEEGIKGLIKKFVEDESGEFDPLFGKDLDTMPRSEWWESFRTMAKAIYSNDDLDLARSMYGSMKDKARDLKTKGDQKGYEFYEALKTHAAFQVNRLRNGLSGLPEELRFFLEESLERFWKDEEGSFDWTFGGRFGKAKSEEPQVNIPRTSSTWPGASDRQTPRVAIPTTRRPGPGAGPREFREASKNVAKSILKGLNQGQKEARNLMTSFDVSWPFRQGATNLHRPEFWKNLYPMVRHFTTEVGYNRAMNKIKNGRRYEQKVKAGVKFTDLDKVREEDFEAKWVNKLPGVKHSNRAYTAMGNTMRDQLFDAFMDAAEQAGIKFGDGSDANSKALAAFINTTTGRANLGDLEAAAKKLNSIFFSPQFVVSRLDMMRRLVDPRSMKGVDPKLQRKLRGEAFKSMGGVLSMGLISAAISSLAMGNTSTIDPTSADFLKLRIGDTRLDFTGGFQQYFRAPAQIMMGEINRSNKFGEGTNAAPYVTAMRFLLSKLSPLGSLTTDIAFGEDVIGRETRTPTGIARGLLERSAPLSLQDIAEVGLNDPKMLPVTIPAGLFGAGIQSYESQPRTGNRTTRPASPRRPASRGPRRPSR